MSSRHDAAEPLEHVDRCLIDPISAAPPRLYARYRSIDDPRIGGQERVGWATYSYISEPHTMDQCPFGSGEVLEMEPE